MKIFFWYECRCKENTDRLTIECRAEVSDLNTCYIASIQYYKGRDNRGWSVFMSDLPGDVHPVKGKQGCDIDIGRPWDKYL